jgi:RIO-like serine/threonine protein kinase
MLERVFHACERLRAVGTMHDDLGNHGVVISDDETIWYVGDYLKKGAKNYSSRIGAFKLGKK